MKERLKTASACFCGSALGCTVSLLVDPRLWWLGLVAGFVAGYLGHGFRETLRAIPHAGKAALETVTTGSAAVAVEIWRDFSRMILAQRHFLTLSFVGTIAIWARPLVTADTMWGREGETELDVKIVLILFVLGMTWAVIFMVAQILALIGTASMERLIPKERTPEWMRVRAQETQLKDPDPQNPPTDPRLCMITHPTTYTGTLLRVVAGIVGLVYICVKCALYIAAAPFVLSYLAIALLVELVKYVHSAKRTLHGFYSALGVGIGYLSLHRQVDGTASTMLVIVCTGIIGAAVGLLARTLIGNQTGEYHFTNPLKRLFREKRNLDG